MLKQVFVYTAAVLLLQTVSAFSLQALVVAPRTMVLYEAGSPCPEWSKVSPPYSEIFFNLDVGNVSHVVHVDCDGRRTVGRPGHLQGNTPMRGYQAYNSVMHTDNIPSIGEGANGSLVVTLQTAAKIEVRAGSTGALIASYPTSGSELSEYTIPASVLSGYNNELVVVDVIRTSDTTYRGTKSIVYLQP
jgi:hypothetical protein